MKRFALLLGVVLGVVIECSLARAAESGRLTIAADGKESSFTLKELRKRLKPVTVAIEDPVYHAKKEFEGFALNEVLALGGIDAESAHDELVFTAKDGYSPNTAFENLRKHKAILAFRERGGRPFGKVAQGKAMVSPAPYYVVWEEGKALETQVPWPYQLVRIEAVQFSKKYAKIFPAGEKPESGVMKGFLRFKNECIRCHSVNLEGGDLGPELNAPRNVTEYWDRKTLLAFISDPTKFRYKSKMPPFPQLKGEEIDQVLDYLAYMKDRKIAAPK